ncbi:MULTISPECIES: hypothetical protein [Clostridium]|uniref:hypothetical protein n=1 Tax=Clostridium TaxID=1485 RepID=UPI0008244084|nr:MULTISPECIES: hypothetical protein [Clostridium]PJI07809.1 hypothetical protein CUB90_08000 [Clostridium sp. CT7]
MKCLKIFLSIFVLAFCIFVLVKTSSLFLSSNSTSNYIATNEVEKRGTPVHSWMIGADHLPHMKVFFWVPKNSTTFIPYANKGVKTNVIGHGPINQWTVIQTGEVSGQDKLIFMFVPKTFVFTHGPNFYKLTHIYYR